MTHFVSFQHALDQMNWRMEHMSDLVHTEKWQGFDISKKPEAAMMELLHESIQVVMPTGIGMLREELKPNLPWADDHFNERVGGEPINPGLQWANWPWSRSAKESLNADGEFNHNYMERYWPRYAGRSDYDSEDGGKYINVGIRGAYGDLDNVVHLLAKQPLTRQAFLPVWFPEDTGDANPGRKPCTLGYHFIMRENRLDITYYIRSCDFIRHFADDIYLSVLLGRWISRKCAEINPGVWAKVTPGLFNMHITSLHMFVGDYQMRYKQNA